MSLPKVSEETRYQVIKEFEKYRDDPMSYCEEMSQKLSSNGQGRNPTISKIINDIALAQFHNMPLSLNMDVYGYMVYRAFEITIGKDKMPLVSGNIEAPSQLDFFSNVKYRLEMLDRVMKQNEEIIRLWASLDFHLDEALKAQVLLVGLYVYRLIESQYESNQMRRSFAP